MKYWVVIFLVAFIIYFPGTNRPLRDAEAKYAEIPKEMVTFGDWLTPHLDFTRYYIKPPLVLWTTAALYKTFGVSERAARMTTFLWGFLAAFLTAVLTKKIFGNRKQSYISSAIFLFTAEVYNYCLDAGLEFGLVSCTVLSLIFFWDFYQKGKLISLGLFYFSLGLGFMAKALLGVVIPGGVAILFLLFQKNGKKLIRLFHPLSLSIFFLITLPWVALMFKRHSDFFAVFFVNEHLHRFIGAMDSNDDLFPTPLWLLMVTGEFFPWVFFLPQLGGYLHKVVRHKSVLTEKIFFLLIWAVVPLLLFSFSKCKGDHYGLNCYPPLIILLSLPFRDLLGAQEFTTSRSWSYSWLIVSVLSLSAAITLFFGRDLRLVQDLGIPSLKVALIFLIALFFLSLWVALSFMKGKVRLAFLGIGLIMVTFFNSTRIMYGINFPHESMKFAADTFNKIAKPGAVLISSEDDEFEHVATLTYYTGQPVFVLRNETHSILHFIQKDREAMCLDETVLERMILQKSAVYLAGETEKTERRLMRLKIPFEIASCSDGRSLFRLEAAEAHDKRGF
jgi:hypothetical protein